MSNDTKDLKELLVYHHHAMETRRAIGLKVFTGTVFFYLALAKGAVDIFPLISADNQGDFRSLFRITLLLILFLFIGFIIQIEFKSKSDRQNYLVLEKKLGDQSETSVTVIKEGFFKTVFRSWAATWPALTLILLTVMFWKLIGLL